MSLSKYTTEVRFICEHYAGLDESAGYGDVEKIVELARPKVFDFTYPFFSVAYKPVLERKILKHFYTREIGFETVGLWKLRLNATLNEIMPYYNRLYESELLQFDPFLDVAKKTTHEGSDSGTRNTDSSATTSSTGTAVNSAESESWNLYSDTPQGGVTGLDSETYLTDARKLTSEEEGSATTTNTENATSDVDETHANENQWVEIVTGKQGTVSYSKMLEEFRNTFLNIDLMIIHDLEALFMGIY